jgi:alkylation response protein AidB-like acyl-CoA dehydrogenase
MAGVVPCVVHSMETRLRRQSDGSFVVSGSKNWITNSPVADVFVVWAKVRERLQAQPTPWANLD